MTLIRRIWHDCPEGWLRRPYQNLIDDFIKSDKTESDLQRLLQGKTLDIGAGFGYLVSDCLDRGYDIWGVDAAYSDDELMAKIKEEMKDKNPNLLERLVAGDVSILPFNDNSFDFIINLCGPLTWTTSQEEFDCLLLEQWRVIREGGSIYISQILDSDNGLFIDNAAQDRNYFLAPFFNDKQAKIDILITGSKKFYLSLDDPDGFWTPSGFALITKLA